MNTYLDIFIVALHIFFFSIFDNKYITIVTFLGLLTTILIELFVFKSIKKVIISILLTFLAVFLLGIDKTKSNIIAGGAFFLPFDENPLSNYIKESLILMVVLNITFVYNPLIYYLHGSMWFNGNLGILSSKWNNSASSLSVILYFIFRYGDLLVEEKRLIKYSVYIFSTIILKVINTRYPDKYVFNVFILLSNFLRIKCVIQCIIFYKKITIISKSTLWCGLDLISYSYFIYDRISHKKKKKFLNDILIYSLNGAFCNVLNLTR